MGMSVWQEWDNPGVSLAPLPHPRTPLSPPHTQIPSTTQRGLTFIKGGAPPWGVSGSVRPNMQ